MSELERANKLIETQMDELARADKIEANLQDELETVNMGYKNANEEIRNLKSQNLKLMNDNDELRGKLRRG